MAATDDGDDSNSAAAATADDDDDDFAIADKDAAPTSAAARKARMLNMASDRASSASASHCDIVTCSCVMPVWHAMCARILRHTFC